MEQSLKGKRALVTGAGRGIGRELVKELMKCGVKVVALSRTESHLKTLYDELHKSGAVKRSWMSKNSTLEIVSVDVSDWNATKEAVEKIGPIDLLVNNAGIGITHSFFDFTEEEFDRIMNINVKSIINISQIVVKGMKERGTGGSIVNVSSCVAKVAVAGYSVYGASKAAVDQLTRVMAMELGPHKIRVNSVNPTVVETDFLKDIQVVGEVVDLYKNAIPLRRFCTTTDVTDTILYLLSDKSAMIHGANIFIDGGTTCG